MSVSERDCVAVIVAAGRGTRVSQGDEEAPAKQYLPLGGRPMLARSAGAFACHPGVAAVRVVIRGEDRDLYDQATDGLTLLEPVIGGATRQDSARLGLESLEGADFGRVLIHDAARPLVGSALISRVLAALDDAKAAVPVLAVTDSLKEAREGRITGTADRTGLYRAQTPQGFDFKTVLEAHRRALADGALGLTDDAAVCAHAGISVAVVEGDEDNLKITTADDLARAERLLAGSAETRIGQGFDIHAFGDRPGPVRLCGLDVAHARGLAGHSDADVGLHALTDALLGAIAAGDIGRHFPDSDPRWKAADSALFVAEAVRRVHALGGTIVHVDVTLICEAPRIAPHADAMSARIAEILGITPDRASVKASTAEGLGAIGRGEGIAAQAVATVRIARTR